jgi:3-oxoacyl-[acyl-carrier-protein] synthase-3
MASAPTPHPVPPAPPARGVELIGSGVGLPPARLTNADLERVMDTSDEWIRQRTGIAERPIVDPEVDSARTLCARALASAIEDAGIEPGEIDMLLVASVSSEMVCPSTACRVAGDVGLGNAGAMDIVAACCGFVFGLNHAYALIRSGACRTVAVIGCDVLSQFMEYTTEGRGTAIIFGDAAGAAIIRATDDMSKGVIAQSMHADGTRWADLYIPRRERDLPEDAEGFGRRLGLMHMNGRDVFRFAVKTFPDLIQETLDKAGLRAADISQFVCHQSNARILEAARERFGLDPDKLYVNIDRYGNTSAGSVPICLHELREAGKINSGDLVMFVAFGGGLTWGSSLWRV